jgi:hypothetical protein
MIATKTWNTQITIEEVDRVSRAEARLYGKGNTVLVGEGTARRNPSDEDVPAIGDELAVARALSDLCHQLVNHAAMDIEMCTHESAGTLRV